MPAQLARYIIPVTALLCLFPAVPSAAALIAGVLIAVFLGNPYESRTKPFTPKLLMWSVIGLGAGMNLVTVARAGSSGALYTAISLAFVLGLAAILMRVLRVERDSGILIAVGTAICGGSAIAAMTPVIRAKSHSVSVALGCVFLLNAAALVIFPPLGHHFGLTQSQFGLWSALAIHDTSSVVGATLTYGPEAAQIGTTVKLARALWILPLTFGAAYIFRSPGSSAKKPWFILGFILMAAIVTYIPVLREPGHWVEFIARRTLVLTLFLIGLGLSKQSLKQVGWRPFLAGFTLWLITAGVTLCAVTSGLM